MDTFTDYPNESRAEMLCATFNGFLVYLREERGIWVTIDKSCVKEDVMILCQALKDHFWEDYLKHLEDTKIKEKIA